VARKVKIKQVRIGIGEVFEIKDWEEILLTEVLHPSDGSTVYIFTVLTAASD
jgi:hypothetical protein